MMEDNTMNFNFGFVSDKSDVLVHLSQWQYWWWFWFSLCWVLYFFILTRLLNKRFAQFNPVMNTSLRSHGKWGDFIVAIIPLTWCGSILINSNFILRMIEWQHESSLFVLRVVGKQWYWIYSYDSTAVQSILSAPKNIGNDRWKLKVQNESLTSNSYYQVLSLGMEYEYRDTFRKNLVKFHDIDKDRIEKFHSVGTVLSVPDVTKVNNKPINILFDNNQPWKDWAAKEAVKDDFRRGAFSAMDAVYKNLTRKHRLLEPDRGNIHMYKCRLKPFPADLNTVYTNKLLEDNKELVTRLCHVLKTKPLLVCKSSINEHLYSVIESLKLLQFKPKTVQLAGVIEESNPAEKNTNKPLIFTLKTSEIPGKIEPKGDHRDLFWGFRQKRFPVDEDDKKYIRETTFKYSHSIISDDVDELPLEEIRILKNCSRLNSHRGELVPVNLAKRLLRVKRSLVLPAHVNITVITNSYDVVHSWFIPGLGLKLDCVPGRSTHHSFYIDNVGFYYGQCAEICGRYHHHMPIRICAIPFEQFVAWWQLKGLHRFSRLELKGIRKIYEGHNPEYLRFRYQW